MDTNSLDRSGEAEGLDGDLDEDERLERFEQAYLQARSGDAAPDDLDSRIAGLSEAGASRRRRRDRGGSRDGDHEPPADGEAARDARSRGGMPAGADAGQVDLGPVVDAITSLEARLGQRIEAVQIQLDALATSSTEARVVERLDQIDQRVTELATRTDGDDSSRLGRWVPWHPKR